MPKNTGKDLEDLVTAINRSLHQNATITPNDRIEDKDTGVPRQIDISIRLSDGPSNFLGIVEVKDWSRRIDATIVEQIGNKAGSVKADAAWIVSRSGFTEPAVKKALAFNIRLITFEDVGSEDWSGWIKCRTSKFRKTSYENVVIAFCEHGSDKLINPADEVVEEDKRDEKSRQIKDKSGKGWISIRNFIKQIVELYGLQPYEGIDDETPTIRRSLLFEETFEPPLFILGEDKKMHRIGQVIIEADFTKKVQLNPISLTRYKEPGSEESFAEIARVTSDNGDELFEVEYIVPSPGEYIPAGTKVGVRAFVVNKTTKERRQLKVTIDQPEDEM